MKISNTALEQYDRCPYQYHQERHQKKTGEPGQGMLMGRVVHRAIETLLKTHKETGRADYIDIHTATKIYEQQWSNEIGLHDKTKFSQGLQQLHDWISNMGVINPDAILEIEKWFSLQLKDDLEIVGVIDLIVGHDIIDKETGEVSTVIEVIDWKTSAGFMSPSDAHDSLQLSIYIMAARQLYPEAIQVKAALHMLHDGIHLPTNRTNQDLAEEVLFIRSMAQRIKTETEWAPTLNTNCIYCHVRRECPAYQDALSGPMPMAVEDYDDLEAIALEHEAMALREKIAKKRKDELATLLKAHLRGTQGMELGERFYRISQSPRKTYPPLKTIEILSKHLDMPMPNVINKVCTVSNTKVNEIIKNDKSSEARMAGAALANIMETTYSSRLTSKKLKPNKKGSK